MIVLDASAAVAVLLNLDGSASSVRERMDVADDLHVPHLFEVEVLNALRRYASNGIPERRSAELLKDLSEMRLIRYPHSALLRRMWELRHNLTAYDAAYVALSETLDLPLITMDERLARAPGIRAAVELYK